MELAFIEESKGRKNYYICRHPTKIKLV